MDETATGHFSLIDLPRVLDARGNLTFIEEHKHIPFAIRRVYYLYDVPGGSERGGHAHRNLRQLLIAIAGSFEVHLDNGWKQDTVHLNRSYVGLLLEPMIWRVIDNFSSGSVCLVLASEVYDEKDYYRDHAAFLADVRRGTR